MTTAVDEMHLQLTPSAAATPSRVSQLFRQSLRNGQMHPMLHLLRLHRADQTPLLGLASAKAADTIAAAGSSAAAPRALIDAARMSEHVAELPAMPQAVTQALAAVASEGASLEDCALHIEHDQALAAQTLKLANSAFFGVAGRVGSIQDAISILGLRTLTMLLTAAAVSARFGGTTCSGFETAVFWRHSVATGLAARAIAGQVGLDPAQCFIAGLLHDIGRLALAVHQPHEVSIMLAWAQQADVALLDAERAVLGLDHVEIGVAIVRRWNFPAAVVEAIAGHHAPAASTKPGVADVVHAADAMVHALDLAGGVHEYVPAVDAPSWLRLGLKQAQALAVLTEVEVGVDDICRLLGFNA